MTSLGLITPYGLGLEAFLGGLASGEALPSPAKCPELDVKEWLPSEKTYLDRCSELALVAAAMALRGATGEDARRTRSTGETPVPPGGEGGVQAPALQGERIGIALGTAYGCLDSMYANTTRVQTKGARLASPLLFMHSFVNAPASLIAIEWGLQGPGATFTDGGLSAASALYWACDLLRRGEVDMMLVGGVEALGEPLLRSLEGPNASTTGVCAGRAQASGPPWEAAAVFLLERAEVAEARGARLLVEVAAAMPPTALPSATPSLSGRGSGGGFYAFGAQFALLMAQALGDLAGRNSGDSVTVQQAEGGRAAKSVLRRP